MAFINADELVAEKIDWLWRRRIPVGVISIIEGEPGTGKSTLTALIAAHVTQGLAWPDGAPCKQGNVVLINDEDDPKSITKPKLDLSGADASRVSVWSLKLNDIALSIPGNLAPLAARMREKEARLLVLDPLFSFLDRNVDAYKDHIVRQALAPLEQIARDNHAAAVIVRHLNKREGASAMNRGGGSIAFSALARVVWTATADPAQDDTYHLTQTKNSWARRKDSIQYRINEAIYQFPDGATDEMPFAVWDGFGQLTSDAVLNVEAVDKAPLSIAVDFLRAQLQAGGGAVLIGSLRADARDAGIKWAYCEQARNVLGLVAMQGADGYEWVEPLSAQELVMGSELVVREDG